MKKKKSTFLNMCRTFCRRIKSGVLLTTCSEGKANTMTISWARWESNGENRFLPPMYVKVVLPVKFLTRPENLPSISLMAHTIKHPCFCGSKSGRDVDKIKELNLTLEEGECVAAAPAIRELPLTLECRVVYKQPRNVALLPAEDGKNFIR